MYQEPVLYDKISQYYDTSYQVINKLLAKQLPKSSSYGN